MRTLVLPPLPAEIERFLERRKALGQDTYDEVWEGTYHMSPAARSMHGYLDDQLARLLGPYADRAGLVGTGPFNLGEPDDYRVPDRGYHRNFDPRLAYLQTAVVVVEIVSPGDETFEKLPFYAAHGVEEVIVVEPEESRVQVLVLRGGSYEKSDASAVLGVGAAEVAQAISWPQNDV
jgi:Uma2 family endonuclease